MSLHNLLGGKVFMTTSTGVPGFPTIVAHRGLKGAQHVENTIPAFRAAIAAHADMIELDIHETQDGQLIVYHDNSLDANTPPWSQLHSTDIRKLINDDERAPLLTECLQAINGLPVNIEVKTYRHIDTIINTLETVPPGEGSFISSFDFNALKELHAHGISLPLFHLMAISQNLTLRQNIRNFWFHRFPHALPSFLRGVSLSRKLMNARFISSMHHMQRKVHVWTVNDPAEWEKLATWKVDGIITDYADRLVAFKQQWQKLSTSS
jgi:glycerophosphoryl diester phosphodiesterase